MSQIDLMHGRIEDWRSLTSVNIRSFELVLLSISIPRTPDVKTYFQQMWLRKMGQILQSLQR